jgi:hypothetical protein
LTLRIVEQLQKSVGIAETCQAFGNAVQRAYFDPFHRLLTKCERDDETQTLMQLRATLAHQFDMAQEVLDVWQSGLLLCLMAELTLAVAQTHSTSRLLEVRIYSASVLTFSYC